MMSKFTNSPLVVHTRISPNKTSPRNRDIDTITIHCVAGNMTIESLGALFAPTTRQASSNYGVGSDGRVGMYVEEKDRSWCTSSGANDHRAITIEVANTQAAHPWPVSDKAMAATIDLCEDICRRNNIKWLIWVPDKNLIGQIDKQNMTVHRWFANKACPGDVLFNAHGNIATEINKRLGAPVIEPTPAPQPSSGFKVGDSVQFTGGGVYTSSTANIPAHSRGRSRCKVTQTAFASNPYHLVSEDGGGVYGWVSASDIAALTPVQTPAEPAPDIAAYQNIIQERCKFSDPAAVWAAIETHRFADSLYERWAKSYG